MLKIGKEALSDPSQVASFYDQCATLESTCQYFEEAYVKMCAFADYERATNGYTKRFEGTESNYISIKVMLSQLIPEQEQTRTNDGEKVQVKSSKVRLPRIGLPKFTGEISDWQAFHTTFVHLVDTNEILTNADKLFNLLSCIQGEAHSLVSHLRATVDAYPIAMDILARRYENPRMLEDTLINRIMQLPQMRTRTAVFRARFLNPLLESSKGLKKLGLGPVAEWSYLLLHIALAKISGELRGKFETQYGARAELFTFNNLITFLEGQCHIMASNEDSQEL